MISKQMTSLSQANQALRNKQYKVAISLYHEVIKTQPELIKVVRGNLKIMQRRLRNAPDVNILADLQWLEKAVDNKELIVKARLEKVSIESAVGWAFDVNHSDQPVPLQINLDGKPYSLIQTTIKRNDVESAHGCKGSCGFKAELTPYLSYSQDTTVSVQPVMAKLNDDSINKVTKNFPAILNGRHFLDVNAVARRVTEKYLLKATANKNHGSTVTVIILNQNGSSVLRDCLKSLVAHNGSAEIIVVDHASTDNSLAMIATFNCDRIKTIPRDKNYSYSESNNLAASKAKGDILVFLNNDILLTSDSIAAMADELQQGDFGLLGIRLWDLLRLDGQSVDPSVKIDQHLGIHFNATTRNNTLQAYDFRGNTFSDFKAGVLSVPAATAAMLAITKQEFEQLGGFTEKYFYGQEDVDLCLRYTRKFGKPIGVLLDHGVYHIRGLSRKTLSVTNKNYILNNRSIIQEEQGPSFRRELRKGLFMQPGFWNQKPLAIAMIVSEIGFETDKADFFTAKELGDALEQIDDIVVGYFDQNTGYNVDGYDVIIVFIDSFDPRKLIRVSPHCILIGWARNWFDRWCERPWIDRYDRLYASSKRAQQHMANTLQRHVGILCIAASSACLNTVEPRADLASDYVFTGSYFNSPRQITDVLKPDEIPYKFKVFGHHWENHQCFRQYTSGPLSYLDIPAVYASTRLVVDDANVATKKWGALNCRVYDALAAGIPCITNNQLGVKELFDDDFPTYNDERVNSSIRDLLGNEKHRKTIAAKYQKRIRQEHTYNKRAALIIHDIHDQIKKPKIAIKIAAPDDERGRKWGDYHFAVALRQEFEARNYHVRIDCMDQWYCDRQLDDDINLVLRGLDRFKPRKDQLNLLWLISHPDLVCEAELRDYAAVYVASEKYAENLRTITGLTTVKYLPQASRFDLSNLDSGTLEKTPSTEILFIGDSRNEYRDVVKWCVEADLPISVYGPNWSQFIPDSFIKGDYIPNNMIPYYYHKAGVVLNDHWQDMRRNGFISNRVYDVICVGGRVLTDYLPGINKVFPKDQVSYYHDKKSFYEQIKLLLENEKRIHGDLDYQSFRFASRVTEICDFLVQHNFKV